MTKGAGLGPVVVGLSSRGKLSRLAGLIVEEQGADVRYLHLVLSPKVNAVFGFDSSDFNPTAWAKSRSKNFHELDLTKESDSWLESEGARSFGQFWTPDLRGLFDSEFLLPRLVAWARSQNISTVSTGHRARITLESERDYSLWRSRDIEHDQSAWLAQGGAKLFSSLLLPLGYLKLGELEKLCVLHEISPQGVSLVDEETRMMDFSKIRGTIDTRSLSRVKQKGYIIDEARNVVGDHDGLINFYPGAPQTSSASSMLALGCDLMKQWLIVVPAEKLAATNACLTARAQWCTTKPKLFTSNEIFDLQVGFKAAEFGKARAKILIDSMLRLEKVSDADTFPFPNGRRITLYRGAQCLGSAQVLESYR
ncbi:MAG: hypothetical protein ABIR96_10490 [Bdellovibrionota bacterium]